MGIYQGLFILILLSIPPSLKIKMLLSSGYMEAPLRRTLCSASEERVEVRESFLQCIITSKIPLAENIQYVEVLYFGVSPVISLLSFFFPSFISFPLKILPIVCQAHIRERFL